VEIEIREVHGLVDLEPWVEVRNRALPHDPERMQMMVLVRATELEQVDLLALCDGEPVGTAMVAGDPHSVETRRPYVEAAVLPQYRSRGIGSALLEAIYEQARQRGYDGVWCSAREDDEATIAFLDSHGFVATHRRERVAFPVTGATEPSPPPPGIELAPFTQRFDALAGMHEVARLTYPEFSTHFAGQTASLLEWQTYELSDEAVILELTLIAFAAEEVAGFATALRGPEEGTASHRTLAVAPTWRRRGVASSLVRAQQAAASELGLDRLTVWCKSEAAACLFDALGYEAIDVALDFAASVPAS
jgi:ribosomal protein S18 acetylase RimI-like enzyme